MFYLITIVTQYQGYKCKPTKNVQILYCIVIKTDKFHQILYKNPPCAKCKILKNLNVFHQQMNSNEVIVGLQAPTFPNKHVSRANRETVTYFVRFKIPYVKKDSNMCKDYTKYCSGILISENYVSIQP